MQNCLIKQTNSGQLNYLQHPLLNSVGADLLRRAIPSGDPVQFLKANSSSLSMWRVLLKVTPLSLQEQTKVRKSLLLYWYKISPILNLLNLIFRVTRGHGHGYDLVISLSRLSATALAHWSGKILYFHSTNFLVLTCRGRRSSLFCMYIDHGPCLFIIILSFFRATLRMWEVEWF